MSRYFATQQSANTVPAQQVVAMAQQQPQHMLQNGYPMMQPQQMMMAQQPMMMAQQPMMQQGMMQPVMMMPNGQMAYAPMAQQPAAMQQKPQVTAAVVPAQVPVKLEHGVEGSREFTVHGVADPHLLEIEAPNLSWQIMKHGAKGNNAYLVKYEPAGKVHNVGVKYNQEHVEGSPFQLMPSAMRNRKVVKKSASHEDVKMTIHPENPHHLLASGVADVDKLHVNTPMAYKMYADPKDSTKFHLITEPAGGVHPLDISYNGEPVPNAQFEFRPKNMIKADTQAAAQKAARANVESARDHYMKTIAAFEELSLNEAANDDDDDDDDDVDSTDDEPVRVVQQQVAKQATKKAAKKAPKNTDTTMENNVPHMTQAAAQHYVGNPVMTSGAVPQHRPMMVPQGFMPQQQQMMMQPVYQNNGMPPMYQMVPPGQQMMPVEQQMMPVGQQMMPAGQMMPKQQ